jgi:peptidoglycan/LPS O-acetylase OafA/YrhL
MPSEALRASAISARVIAATESAPVAETAPRVAAVDGLRGLLALVVVIWHVAAPAGAPWLLAAANLSVGMFFILSGYALARGWSGNLPAFLARRFVRLWPVYAVCLAAGYAAAGVRPEWSQFLWYPLILPNSQPAINPPAWSLCLEVWMMPFMPLVIWAGRRPLARAAGCIAALALAGILVRPQIGVAALFVAGAYFSDVVYRNRFLESAAPQWLGRVSYSLYLCNWVILSLAKREFGPWGGIMAAPLVLGAAWLLWRYVEKPSIAMSRRIGRAIEGWSRRASAA